MPRGLVSALKFGGRLALADVAAEAIARSLGELGEERAGMRSEARPPPDAIVPVPPAFLRRRLRGFDPAELIASRLSARLDLPICTCLRRVDHRRQVGKPRSRRLGDPPRIRVRGGVPPRVLMIDDVITTGATLGACARALRGAGGERVDAAVFARSL